MKFTTLTLLTTLFMTEVQTNGVSPYVFPDFVKGSVLQKNGGATDGVLNYNTITQEMLFIQDGQRVVLEMPSVDTIFIQNKKFIPATGNIYYQKVTETKIPLYVQLISKPLLRGRNPDLDDQKNNVMSAGQGFRAKKETFSKYDLKFGDGYTMEPQNILWLQNGKDFVKIEGVKNVVKVFPQKEQAINSFVKEHNTDFKKTTDVADLIKFCDQ